ncbi:MAG: TonB-dependent receptor [Marinilabiliales bacterium]|nr:TonB-dependent receptor [Marinilabiliales bacterium]
MDILRGYGAVTVNNTFEKLTGALKLYDNFGEHTLTDGFHSRDKNYGLNFYQTLMLRESTQLSFGADLAKYGGKAENTKAMNGKVITFADTTVSEAGVYAFLRQTLFTNFSVSGGMRWQNHSKYGTEWIPSAGFAWQLSPEMTWRGNFSKGFRSPTIRELYMFNHNPNLQPERVYSWETGWTRNFPSLHLKGELTLYTLKGDNLIVTGAMGNLFNTGKLNNKGVELALTANPVRRLDLNLTYSYIHMDSPLFATPKTNLYLSGTYHWNRFRLTGSVQQIGDLNNDSSGKIHLVDYTLVNAKAAWSLSKRLDLTLSGENLLGAKYEPNRYYPMPGTTLFAGLNLRLGNM